MNSTFAMFGMPGGTEWIFLLVLGVLLFGRKLPEVGRYLGKGIVEFKKGIKGIEDEIEPTVSSRSEPAPIESSRPPQKVQVTTPRFDDSPVTKG